MDYRSTRRLGPLKFAVESTRMGGEGGVGRVRELVKKWEDPKTTLKFVLRVTE